MTANTEKELARADSLLEKVERELKQVRNSIPKDEIDQLLYKKLLLVHARGYLNDAISSIDAVYGFETAHEALGINTKNEEVKMEETNMSEKKTSEKKIEKKWSPVDPEKLTSFSGLPKRLVMIDIETTGVNLKHDEIIQVAAVRLQLTEEGTYKRLFRPGEVDFFNAYIKTGKEATSSFQKKYQTEVFKKARGSKHHLSDARKYFKEWLGNWSEKMIKATGECIAFDLSFLLRDDFLKPCDYVEIDGVQKQIRGTFHYNSFEISTLRHAARQRLKDNPALLEKYKSYVMEDAEKPGAHDALTDCFNQIDGLNKCLKIMQDNSFLEMTSNEEDSNCQENPVEVENPKQEESKMLSSVKKMALELGGVVKKHCWSIELTTSDEKIPNHLHQDFQYLKKNLDFFSLSFEQHSYTEKTYLTPDELKASWVCFDLRLMLTKPTYKFGHPFAYLFAALAQTNPLDFEVSLKDSYGFNVVREAYSEARLYNHYLEKLDCTSEEDAVLVLQLQARKLSKTLGQPK